MPEPSRARDLEAALLDLDEAAARTVLVRAFAELGGSGLGDRVVAPALEALGRGWEAGTVALSQVFMAGRILERALAAADLPPMEPPRRGVVGVAVLEDHHALGKRIVLTALRCAGYEVRDLGAGLSPHELVARAEAERVDLLMISVLMLNRALRVRAVRELLDQRPGRRLPLVVGGAPFTHDPTLADRVGADGWGRTAADALALAARFLEPPP